MENVPKLFLLCSCFLFACLACEKKAPTENPVLTLKPVIEVDPSILPRTEAAWLKGIGFANEGIAESDVLRDTVQDFLQNPDKNSLQAAREQWLISHETFAQLGLFITLGHNNPGLFGQLLPTNFFIDAQPISPGYLDYFDVYKNSGIVNDIAVPLTAQTLRKQHGFSDPSEVSIGFHAIEYLLWGETGNRLADDYIAIDALDDSQISAGIRIIDLPNNRRRVLLNLLSVILVDDINKLKRQLENPADLIRLNYSALTPQSRMQLLQAAGYTLLTHQIEWLDNLKPIKNAKDTSNEIENDGASSDDDAINHSEFSDEGPNLLLAQLQTIENILFDQEIGFLPWILSSEQEPLLEKFQETIQKLADRDNREWPLNDDQKQEMISTLNVLAEAIAPPSISDLE